MAEGRPQQTAGVPASPGGQPCVTEGCHNDRLWKGLCRSCYGQALYLIKNNETTWVELAAMGLVVMDKKPFFEAFRRKKAELEKGNH